jgi:hypothetical protein
MKARPTFEVFAERVAQVQSFAATQPGGITSADVASLFGVPSIRSVQGILQRLVKHGVLVHDNARRFRRYFLASNAPALDPHAGRTPREITYWKFRDSLNIQPAPEILFNLRNSQPSTFNREVA